jgi:hypothetical protein
MSLPVIASQIHNHALFDQLEFVVNPDAYERAPVNEKDSVSFDNQTPDGVAKLHFVRVKHKLTGSIAWVQAFPEPEAA